MLLLMDTVVFWLALAVIMFSYMSLWYGVALYAKRFDVVDSAWGLGFVLVAWSSLALHDNFGLTQLVSALLVSTWGVRLFIHISRRNWRKPTEDKRYQELRVRWGNAAHQRAYSRIFLLQGLLVLLISTPMIAVALTRSDPGFLSYVGWVVWVFGIAYEAVADRQLATFIAHRDKKSHAIMRSGLWRYSRHPNYFGEIITWCGAAIVAVSVGSWWGIIGVATITWLITKVSGIPPLEKHYEGNSEYEAYRRHTPALVPRFSKLKRPS